jgi:serine/threonine protein kinase
VDEHARRVLHALLTGADPDHRPPKLIREWQIEAPIDRTDRWAELFATHRITGEQKVLRVYDVPLLADEAVRKRAEDLFRWEAQVLRRIGQHPAILGSDPPFVDEAGMVLPFEAFVGVTLGTWIDKHGGKLAGPAGVRAKIDLWRRVVEAIDYAHAQGVVHRLLRPEVVLVEDATEPRDLRVMGFELAKQTWLPGQTVAVSQVADERRRWSAPEVVRSFSDADARSDQFSLGALLGHVLAGRPLFDSTEELLRRGGAYTRLRDIHPGFKQSLDQALAVMLERSSANRYRSLRDAVEAIEQAASGKAPAIAISVLDPENLAPGTQIGSDYEIREKLGAGGMATVYLARHLVSGSARALKIARPDPKAEDALRAEHQALDGIDHPNIVRCIDITSVVPERKTLILERLRGESLTRRLAKGALTDEERRQYAENLLAAIGYLEQRGIVHKDVKPDNLIVGAEGLTLIDFSLAGWPATETLAGTALYRDPALERWSPVADRYAAALCLFELYVGRHAFDGHAPFPGQPPHVDAQDFDRPALADFFRKTLAPSPAERYPSAAAMRAALVSVLGSRASATPPSSSPLAGAGGTARAPLSATALSGTALGALRRAGITTQGALVALDQAKIRNLPGLGNKKREEILALRRALVEAGVEGDGNGAPERHPLYPTLIGDETDVHRLGLPAAVTQSLERAGYTAVGRLADATRDDLLPLPGVGMKTLAQIVQALQRFAEAGASVEGPQTLDALWDRAAAPLQGRERQVIERLAGLHGRPATQVELEGEIGLGQPAISLARQKALGTIDRRALDEVVDHVEGLLVSAGGLLPIDEAAARLSERWPALDDAFPAGLCRLLAELEPTRIASHAVLDDERGEVLARPLIGRDALVTFLRAARENARWPPPRPEATRSILRSYLPEYPHDPIGLAVRLDRDLRTTEDGELYQAPVTIDEAVRHLLHKSRPPLSLDALRDRILASFGEAVVPAPDPEALVRVVAALPSFRYDPAKQEIDVREARSIEAGAHAADPLPAEYLGRDSAEVARALLREMAKRDGFRLLVAPPEAQPEIARSVARALDGAAFVSFEDAFFRSGDATVEALDRAERFAALRPKLRQRAEEVLDAIVREHGASGRRVVLGDTAILGVCEAIHVVRRLYDQVALGGRGFWALVVPGVVHQRQPLFNERPGAIVFSVEGATVPVPRELPAG